jgi:integral membrane sensor domain MASE1
LALRLSTAPAEAATLPPFMTEAPGAPISLADAFRYLVLIVIIASAYFVGARLGLAVAFSPRQVSAVWPPAGIALAAFTALGRRVWPGVFMAAFSVNAMADEPIAVAFFIACGNTAMGLVGAQVLRALPFDGALERSRDVVSLLAVTVGSTLISATMGTAALGVGGVIAWPSSGPVWRLWWAGDSLGILIVAPVLLTWFNRPRLGWQGLQLLEFTVYLGVTTLIGLAVFVWPIGESPFFYPRAYVAFPLLAWAGLRLGSREAALGVAILAMFAIWGSANGYGPFSRWAPDARLVLLDAFIGTAACTALLIAAVISERQGAQAAAKEAQARLREAYGALEERVRARTAELAEAVEELGQRNREKETLLREIHHRVKNNLQVVCSLLNLQAHGQEEPRLLAFAEDCRARVRSMALVHEHLYQSNNLQSVPITVYVGALLEEVVHSRPGPAPAGRPGDSLRPDYQRARDQCPQTRLSGGRSGQGQGVDCRDTGRAHRARGGRRRHWLAHGSSGLARGGRIPRRPRLWAVSGVHAGRPIARDAGYRARPGDPGLVAIRPAPAFLTARLA